MGVTIKTTAGYLYLDSWVLANIIQLATLNFCRRFLDKSNDPCGRQYDQMTQAARSVTANIAEGSSRHQTSRETEMKLTDVARASLSELAGDYLCFIMAHRQAAWPKDHPAAMSLRALRLDAPHYGADALHDASAHILTQAQRFAEWTAAPDAITCANALLILCGRLSNILRGQLERQLSGFKADGGFSENLTQERLTAIRQQAAASDAPQCPRCGLPMMRRTVRRGSRAGQEFWSCSDYPNCHGSRPIAPQHPSTKSQPPSTQSTQSIQSIQSKKQKTTATQK